MKNIKNKFLLIAGILAGFMALAACTDLTGNASGARSTLANNRELQDDNSIVY